MKENSFKRDEVIKIMQSRGISIREFIEESGISKSSLSTWLPGFRHSKKMPKLFWCGKKQTRQPAISKPSPNVASSVTPKKYK